jgi:hypothetical protein
MAGYRLKPYWFSEIMSKIKREGNAGPNYYIWYYPTGVNR